MAMVVLYSYASWDSITVFFPNHLYWCVLPCDSGARVAGQWGERPELQGWALKAPSSHGLVSLW